LLSTKQQVARWHIGDLDLTAQWNLLKHKNNMVLLTKTSKPIYNYGICDKALQAEVIDMMLDLDQIIEE
jgi:hypothetical protein